jgi:hypothetical protein
MSHIAEVYAKELGVRVGKPEITKHFIPGLPDNFITIKTSNLVGQSHYRYWDIVVSLLAPFLQKEKISIVQIGNPKDFILNNINARFLSTTEKQKNYILSKSKCHIGHDDICSQISSVYDIPSTVIYGNIYSKNTEPIFNVENNSDSLSVDFSKTKPSFNHNVDRCNEIKPERIAQSVLKNLKINEKIKFKTIRAGNNYANAFLEAVPNFFPSDVIKGQNCVVRGDIHFDINNIARFCQLCSVTLHINDTFDFGFLRHLKNLKEIVFIYEDKYKDIDLNNFFSFIKNNKINLTIVSDSKEDISDIRLKYFDYTVLERAKEKEKIKNCKFLSKKTFVNKDGQFLSESSANRLDKTNAFVYDDISSKELENLYLYDD